MMTVSKNTYTEPVATLLTLGDVRGEKAWRDYLALGFTEQHVPDLCQLILDKELFWADSESDEVWSAIHGWRTLAQLKAESAIPALIKLLGQDDDNDWASEELPVVFGHIGAAALEPLTAFLADDKHNQWIRSSAGSSFAEIGQRHPELREQCITILTRQLEQFDQQTDTFNALLIGNLCDLQAVEAAPVMEQAFAADKVDLMIQGDWEAVQIELGLLTERITPEPDYRQIMADQMGVHPDELLSNLKSAIRTKSKLKAERQGVTKKKAKAKQKRKQAKKSRKKQRKRK